MQFNSQATNQDLISDISFLLGVDTNKYTIADRTRAINEWQNKVWTWIFMSYGGWVFMGDDQSDASTGVPYAEQTITSGTGLYALPSGSLAITGVSVVDSAGNRHMLKGISQEEFNQLGGDAHFTSNGVPLYYMLQGDIMRLLPIPNFTVSSTGIRIYFDKPMTSFATTDTTAVPGFASVFHRVLSIGAALDYAMARGMKDKVAYLQPLVDRYQIDIQRFYAERWRDRKPMIKVHDLMQEFS